MNVWITRLPAWLTFKPRFFEANSATWHHFGPLLVRIKHSD